MLQRNRPSPDTAYAISISEFSLKRCFWRLFIMEKAILSESSPAKRWASTIGWSSPLMRMNGKLPALMCRSDAPLLHAIVSNWSMLGDIALASQLDLAAIATLGTDPQAGPQK